MAKRTKLVIIDGHALIHRAYHGLPPLTTKEGEVVNAVYGFSMILLNVIRDIKPDCIAVAFDLPGKTVRHDAFSQYKANRVAAPDDLKAQIGRVREVVEAFNIPIYSYEGYEADDVIGTLTKHDPENIDNIIVTGDMDELQLVNGHTKVYTMRRGFTDTVIYDTEMVKERYGLRPDQLVDYKALKGDPSDNIPGVAGIGEKTACELIGKYESLENLYKHLDELKPAVAEKLKTGQEIAFLSQELSRIVTDLPVKFELDKCYVHDYDRGKVFDLFQKLGFKSLLSRLPETKKGETETKVDAKDHLHLNTSKYQLVNTEKDFQELCNKLSKQKVFALDTETDSLNEIKANLVGLSFSWKAGEAYYVPVGHKNCPNLDLEKVAKALKPILENPKIAKVGHNIKYDYVVLKKYGLTVAPITYDTMVGAYLLNPNARAQRLDELAFSELGIEMVKIEQIIGSGKNQVTFADGDIKDCSTYACEDADVTWQLYEILQKELAKNDQLELMNDIEAPLIPVLAEMEINGIQVDCKKLEATSKQMEKRIAELEKSICQRGGCVFNIGSPAQLSDVLFKKLKLDEKVEDVRELKKLKSGSYSTAAGELEKLRGLDPIIEEIFEYRELTKLKNTYVDVLPKLADDKNRIHTSFNQAITQTGRLSSSEPNLQNIPIRTEEGRKIREAFIADPGFVLMSADYSQIELRIMAHIAKDPAMVAIFKAGRDIHTETAAKVYGVPQKEVTANMRRVAKTVNFGIIYGVSAHGLKQQLGITREEGQELIDKYFKIHPQVDKYMEKMIVQAWELGHVETIFGRRRYLPEIKSGNFMVRGSAERMAINMPVQGTAADLMKLAMIDVAKELPKVSPKSKLLLQVHDELVLEVPEKEAKKVSEFVKTKMDNVVKLSVPIETAVHWGKNWEEAKE